jgi:hypothetical protein
MKPCSSPDNYQHCTAGHCLLPGEAPAKNWQQCTKINHTLSYFRNATLNIYFRIYFISSYSIRNFIPKFLYDINNLRHINKQINNICVLYIHVNNFFPHCEMYSLPCAIFHGSWKFITALFSGSFF